MIDYHELAVSAVLAVSRAYGAWSCDQSALEQAADELVTAVTELGGDYPEDWPKARATLERLSQLR